MPRTAHHQEIEIKLRVKDVDAFCSRLKCLHAREISPRTYESNTLFDTPGQDLRRCGQLIRIRIEQPASSFGKKHPSEATPAILTYKGPSTSSRKLRNAGIRFEVRDHFKIKDEAEVSAANADEMARILHALGLQPVFRYEKFRTTYALPGIRGLKVELDETPIGIYVELEGPVKAIDRGARRLGYERKDYLTGTYGSLYLADCRRRAQKAGNMLFPPTRKLR